MRPLLLSLTLLCVLSACRRDKGECPSDRVCTMEFRSITVEVRDGSGTDIVLDSTRTVRNSDGRVFRFEPFMGSPQLNYVVLSDAEMNAVNTQGVAFRFEGFLADSLLVAADYVIRHDCCHVQKMSGPAVITAGP